MKNLYSFLAAGLLSFSLGAQTFFSNNGQVFISAGAIVQVNGNVETSGANAITINNGDLTVSNSLLKGDFIITSGTVSGLGEFNIEGGWINNGNFTNNSGSKVNLTGSNQLITGSTPTIFHDLELLGTGVKTQTINAMVAGNLILNSRELATQDNIMYVSNNDPAAISNNQTSGSEGFVSSTGNGALSRQTNSAVPYYYPVGSGSGTKRYRPVEIRPSTSAMHIYDVRLANNDPNDDGLNRSLKDTSLCRINPYYYHKINRTYGSDPADITLYFKSGDGDFDAIGNCRTASSPFWEGLANVNSSAVPGNFYTLSSIGQTNFNWNPFALGEAGGITAGFDTSDIGFFSEAYQFTDNSSGLPVNWYWEFGDGNSSNQQNPSHEYRNPGFYEVMLVAETDKGCSDTAYKTLEVREGAIIPNVFSPNGDGINDVFRIPSVGLSDFDLQIFNRWGDKIFEAQTGEIAWDGRTFSGKEVPAGTYFFILKALSKDKDYYPEKTGHITLVR